MRALHVNPWRRTVIEIDLDDDGDGFIDYQALRAAVFYGRPAHQRGFLRRVVLGNGLMVCVDMDALDIPWEEQRFCCVGGEDLGGHVVVTGDSWGGAIELPRHVNADSLCVQWLDAREVVESAETHA